MPTPTVAVLIIKDDEVLLVKHGPKAHHLDDSCGLPSGRLEPGETEKQAAARELKEETGLIVTEGNLIEFPGNFYIAVIPDGIKEYSWRVFLCNSYAGNLQGSEETTPFWAKISDLDSTNLLPNVKNAVMAGLKSLNK